MKSDKNEPTRAATVPQGVLESAEVTRLKNSLAAMPPDRDWRFVEQIKEMVVVPVSEWPSPSRPPEKVEYKIRDRWECKLTILTKPGQLPREAQQEAIDAAIDAATTPPPAELGKGDL